MSAYYRLANRYRLRHFGLVWMETTFWTMMIFFGRKLTFQKIKDRLTFFYGKIQIVSFHCINFFVISELYHVLISNQCDLVNFLLSLILSRAQLASHLFISYFSQYGSCIWNSYVLIAVINSGIFYMIELLLQKFEKLVWELSKIIYVQMLPCILWKLNKLNVFQFKPYAALNRY